MNEELVLIEEKTFFEIKKEELLREQPPNKFRALFLKTCYFRIVFVEVCDRIIKSKIFDRLVVTVIILNSLYLAIDDYNFQNNPSK